MASADEIRKWAVGKDQLRAQGAFPKNGELVYPLPVQPSSQPGTEYLRCAGEQRIVIEAEIAAQLAELNEILRDLVEKLQECILMR